MTPFLQSIAQKWRLVGLLPLEKTSASYLLSGFQDTKPIVLKISSDETALEREAGALQAFSGYQAVEVLAYQPGALLLERVRPGPSLTTLPHSQLPVQIACHVMKRLHQAPSPNVSFPTIDEWLRTLDVAWDLPASYLKRAQSLRDHYGPSVNPVLLHGDLHRGNILAQGGDWVAIDPKGVMGNPIHEVWALLKIQRRRSPGSLNISISSHRLSGVGVLCMQF